MLLAAGGKNLPGIELGNTFGLRENDRISQRFSRKQFENKV
jgi:hypothetical protein